jgi:hypothetical protein
VFDKYDLLGYRGEQTHINDLREFAREPKAGLRGGGAAAGGRDAGRAAGRVAIGGGRRPEVHRPGRTARCVANMTCVDMTRHANV